MPFYFPGFSRVIFFVFLATGIIFSKPLCAQPNAVPAATDTSISDSSKYIIRSISITGNKQTKDFIITREFTYKVGDTLSGSQLIKESKRTEQNLLNTSLFNFATISPADIVDSVSNGYKNVAIFLTVRERWYTWPAPFFEVAEQNFNTWWRNGRNLQRASYGFSLTRYNFRGRKESIALICRFGYAQQYGAQYAIPYLNRKQTLGVTFTGTYTRSHEVSYATRNNVLQFFKDRDRYIRAETAGSIMFSYRQGLYIRHTLDLRYTNLNVSDTVTDLAADYFGGGRTQMEYFTVSYHITRDFRDIKAYPLKGHYEEFEATKHGLGILADEKLNVLFFVAGVRKYGTILPRLFYGVMGRVRWLPGPVPPYYHQRALGFSNFVRGYEYYVIDGQSYALGKVNIRYQLLKPHVYKIPYLPLEKFNLFHIAIYTGIYGDMAYVEDRASIPSDHNKLGNTLLFGYGAGIDLVTYYDVCLRLEYSFNHLGENGLFLHMGAPF